MRFPESIAASTSESRGPEFPIQVVQPYPTTLNPSASRSFVKSAASKYSVTTLEPGAKLGLTHGAIDRPAARAFRANSPAAIMTLGLLVLVQLVIAAITRSPCLSSTPRPSTAAESSLFEESTPWPL